MPARQKTISLTIVFALAWGAAVAFGLRTLLTYENTPGSTGRVAQTWPAQSKIRRAIDRPTLVMLAHPRCPCTRATMGELAEVLARSRGKVAAYVLFFQPEKGIDWEETDLQRSAAGIPGVTVVTDRDGAEAALFGAETSGHTLLFDKDGRLLFSGGITASRGHAGDNVGENALAALIDGNATARRQTLVFGCPLAERKEKEKQCSR